MTWFPFPHSPEACNSLCSPNSTADPSAPSVSQEAVTGSATQMSGWSELQKGGLWREVQGWGSGSSDCSHHFFLVQESVYQYLVRWKGFFEACSRYGWGDQLNSLPAGWEGVVFSHLILSDSCDPMHCSPPGSSVYGIL